MKSFGDAGGGYYREDTSEQETHGYSEKLQPLLQICIGEKELLCAQCDSHRTNVEWFEKAEHPEISGTYTWVKMREDDRPSYLDLVLKLKSWNEYR